MLSVVFWLLLAASFIQPVLAAHTTFKANLTGAQEVPAVTTNATGTAVLTLTPAGGLNFIVTANGLSGPIGGAHFHLGAAGTNGPIIRDITNSFSGGTTATGSWRNTDTPALVDSVIAAFMAGRIYINIHTAANPNGEIRGQVLMSSGTSLTASLEGNQEVPAVTTTAKGTAALSLSSVGGVGLVYNITVNGLSGTITGAHFHLGSIGFNGPVVRDIKNDFKGNTATGVWRTGTGSGALVDSLIVALLTGRMYLNIHTAANPNGEIRGQIHVNAGFGFGANLDGSQEIPPVITTAKGTASLTLTEYGLVYSLTVDGLSGPIATAHFHNAAAGVNGAVVRTIATSNNNAVGIWKSNDLEPFTSVMLRELLAGNIYINIHTAANFSGEIRGQVTLKPGSGATARFDGAQEVPALTNNAKGTASLTLTSTGVAYEITVTGLSGPIVAAHFHMTGIGKNGPVVKDIKASFSGQTATGIWGTSDATEPFTETLRAALVAGQIYLNIHTVTNPGGEVRGQVIIDAGTGFKADLTSGQEVPPLSTNGSGTGSFTLNREGLTFNISTTGLNGSIAAAHFHRAESGKLGGVVFSIPTTNIIGANLTGYWRTPAGTLVDSLIVALLTGRIYVNIHTMNNPNGEIRSQVNFSEGTGLTAFLNGAQENPPVTTTARGTGVLVVNDAGATFHATGEALSGPITLAHLHNAATGVNGPITRTITNDFKGNTASGLWRSTDNEPLTNQLLREIFAGNIYFNIHTAANPSGEIRGQARTGAIVFTNQPPVVSNAISNQTLTVGGTSFTRNINTSPVVFTDADGDALTYTASSSATSVATASISGSTLTVTPVAAGNATITVTANDGRGGSISTSFSVVVNAASNQAPAIPTLSSPLANAFTNDNTPSLRFNVPADPNNDQLHFRVEIDDDGNFDAGTQTFESRTGTANFNPTPPVTQGSGQVTYTVQAALTEGDWWWRVSAWDGQVYGNPSVARKFIVDMVAPFTSNHNPAKDATGVLMAR